MLRHQDKSKEQLLEHIRELEKRNGQLERTISEREQTEKGLLFERSQQISQIILSKLDSNQIIEALSEQIILGGIFRSLMVALVDEETQIVRVVGSFIYEEIEPNHEELQTAKRKLKAYPNIKGLQYQFDDDNITAVTARTGTMQIIEEWDERLDTKVNSLEERRGKVAYFIPIKQGERVLAVLATGSQIEEKERTLVQIDMMTPLWDQVAIALDHARLYETLQQQVAKREQIEKSLRTSEERFRTLFRDAPVAYFSVQPNGQIRQVNEQGAALLGLPQDNLIGTPVIDLYADAPSGKEKAQRMFQRFIKGETIRNEELQMQHRDGRVIWVSLTVTPMYNEQGEILESRSVAIDITDRKRMEEDLRRTHNLESLGVLAGGIAHDFNNVLTGVIGNLALIERLADAGSEMQTIAKEGKQAADRTRDLTRQLLTFAKGGAPVREIAVLEDLLRETAAMSLHGSNAKAQYDLDENLHAVEVDRGQIGQVIQNLVLNADQAMPAGGIISITAENTEISTATALPLTPGNYVVVCIGDEGGGIPPSQIERIFDPYFTTKDTGHGLGLSIVHSIVQRHGGYIQVYSQIDVGTTFEFHLPAALAPATKLAENKRTLQHGSGRILMVDDEELIHSSVGRILTVIGYEVSSVYDGAEALTAYRESMEQGTPYDAVIVDLTIPGGMGGIETLEQLIKIDADARIIVSSGYANDPVLADFSTFGFAGKIAKPVDIQELAETLASVLQSSD